MDGIDFDGIDKLLQTPFKQKKETEKTGTRFKLPKRIVKPKPKVIRIMEDICRNITLDDKGRLIKLNKISKKSGYKGDPRILSMSHKKAYKERVDHPLRFHIWFCEQERTEWTVKEARLFKSRMMFFKQNMDKWKGWGGFSMEFPYKSGVKCISYKKNILMK